MFELRRLDFSMYGSLKEQTKERKIMLMLTMLIIRILIVNVFMRIQQIQKDFPTNEIFEE